MIRASASDRSQAMKRGETGRIPPGAAAASELDEVLVREQGDGGQRATNPLHRVLDGEDRTLADDLAAGPERFFQHEVDLLLGLDLRRDAVELHDDAVLGRIIGDGVAD